MVYGNVYKMIKAKENQPIYIITKQIQNASIFGEDKTLEKYCTQ